MNNTIDYYVSPLKQSKVSGTGSLAKKGIVCYSICTIPEEAE